jgi:hypothetical protein
MSTTSEENIRAIRSQIQAKLNYNAPYYASVKDVERVLTDRDHFPYKREFRGIYYLPYPVIVEREAGYRPRNDLCYKALSCSIPCDNSYCWQKPCSTVLPCRGDTNTNRDSNRDSNEGVKKRRHLAAFNISP